MEKSLHINFRSHFGQAITDQASEQPKPSLNIRHADKQYYTKEENWAIAQEFDGKHGYLFGYDLWLEQAVTIPVRVDIGDLYVVYVVEGNDDILIRDAADDLVCTLAQSRARYLYVPPGDYHVELSRGQHQIFGFYFDGGIFRDGNERSFRCLHEVIDGYRNNAKSLIHSIDLLIGPKTRLHITHLCKNLTKGDFNNETFIFDELSRLIQLSRLKVHEEYEQINPVQHLADNAIELVKAYVHTHGQAFSIQYVADDLGVTAAHLCRVFKDEKLLSPRSYKDRFLLVRCKKELLYYQQLGDVAERCQFSSVASFSRFFKKHTGQTPGAYKDELYRLHDSVSL
ncbi:helix-turn-helix transcriptional regulator [Sphingobacterium arenae]|uniref:Helix-turn-helix transcriptional regulator n=1 Tax=Sphingobacterium arenae TaxID=1280598 RepID=A0ABR7Y8S6_9SPHI|nr:helix-turn-helix transcriptional regulator [Sphingobacterium arenae]MBD1427706.1 helix-turn-helix transcriptional regulator [Sphingobacterium arenae]